MCLVAPDGLIQGSKKKSPLGGAGVGICIQQAEGLNKPSPALGNKSFEKDKCGVSCGSSRESIFPFLESGRNRKKRKKGDGSFRKRESLRSFSWLCQHMPLSCSRSRPHLPSVPHPGLLHSETEPSGPAARLSPLLRESCSCSLR